MRGLIRKPLARLGDKDTAYRGYLIKELRGNQFSIQKDGTHIGYAASTEQAKHIIDQLV